MHRCLISFGANIGDAKSTVLYANQLLQQMLGAGDSVTLSRLYQTPPVGGPTGQSAFINAVAALNTQLSPWEVWHVLRTIENQLGRQRQRRWEARRIDLDILLYDQQLIWTPQLKIPHPRMCMRRFILLPAADVAAEWIDPVSQLSIAQLCQNLDDCLTVGNGAGNLMTIAAQADLPLQETVSEALLQTDHPIESQAIRRLDLNELLSAESARSDKNLLQDFGKLLIAWTGIKEGSAWEDQHRSLAIKLRLSPTEAVRAKLNSAMTADVSPQTHSAQPLPWNGPRYLLATNDAAWALHEIAAALDAMRCEIQPA